MATSPSDWHRLSLEAELTDEDVADIVTRLERMDAREGTPWTVRTLELIRDNPEVVSTELADRFGMERFAWKKLVYKLKKLGLTHSLRTGYRISPRGAAFLSHPSAFGES